MRARVTSPRLGLDPYERGTSEEHETTEPMTIHATTSSLRSLVGQSAANVVAQLKALVCASMWRPRRPATSGGRPAADRRCSG
jgi:hypothetical protein